MHRKGCPPTSPAHDLAIRGARAWVEESDAERRALDEHIEFLITASTEAESILDAGVLAALDHKAWRLDSAD